MKKTGLILTIVLILTGCDFASDMQDLLNKQQESAKYVKEKYGVESQLGFNYSNGQLIQATLILKASEVSDKSVDELEEMAADVVQNTFDSKPQTTFIQLYTQSN